MEPWVAGKGRTEGKKSVKGGRDPDILPVIVLILCIDYYAPAATQNALHLSRAFLVESRNLAVGNLSLLPGNLNRLFKFSLICIILANVTNINCSFS